VTKGFAHDEALTSLQKTNQELLSYLYLRVGTSRRIFDNRADDGVTLLGRLDMTNCPATLVGSKLPTIYPAGSFDVASTLCAPASFGNMLLFLSQGDQVTYRGVTNIFNVGVTVTLDTYKLYYFYLTPNNPKNTTGYDTYRLIEWRSVPLADGRAIKNAFSSDVSFGTNLLSQIKAPTPCPTYQAPMTYAVDFSMPVTQMFGTVNQLAQATTAASVAYATTIPGDYWPVTQMVNGVPVSFKTQYQYYRPWTYMNQMGMGHIFRYGISSNSISRKVPKFGIASGLFPGGFEVGIIGSQAARQVLVRVNHVAQAFGADIVNDQLASCFARDVY
jgi:hypothetical protein